jgi:pimeloyl-ACP methyl ester carboxylesterase
MEKTLSLSGYKCRTLYSNTPGIPLVFLHGLSYNIEIWQQIGVTDLLLAKHVPFLMLDMPYGMKSNCKPKTRNPEKNILFVSEAVKNVFEKSAPVLVGASIGGHMALQYAAKFPVKGLLLIAPSRALTADLREIYYRFNFPVRIIWGSQDNIVSGEEMRTLEGKLQNAKLRVYNGAGHSAYKNETEQFKKDLMELYATTEQTKA